MATKRISQVDISKVLGKEKSTINHWIKYDRIPSADYALQIADYLGQDLRYLITGVTPGESQLYYKNTNIKPIVDLLDGLDNDSIEMAYIGLRTQIEVERQIKSKLLEKEDNQAGTA